ncbi:MAG TPA: hypothetical protein VED40_00505 [Azospirillaceae bacterium]|nr:hypothetical protein [Azospirillaceae bacterium]
MTAGVAAPRVPYATLAKPQVEAVGEDRFSIALNTADPQRAPDTAIRKAAATDTEGQAAGRETPERLGGLLRDRIGLDGASLAAVQGADAAVQASRPTAADTPPATEMPDDPAARARSELQKREAEQRLETAQQRVRLLQIQARLAAASGDTKEAERIAREAAVVAREVGAAAKTLSNTPLASDPPKGASRDKDGPPADVSEIAAQAQAALAGGQGGAYLNDARSVAAQARSLMDLAAQVRGGAEGDGKTLGEELAEMVSGPAGEKKDMGEPAERFGLFEPAEDDRGQGGQGQANRADGRVLAPPPEPALSDAPADARRPDGETRETARGRFTDAEGRTPPPGTLFRATV